MKRPQFSLRLLLLIVTLLAITFAWRRIATDAFRESNRDQIEYVKLQLGSLEAQASILPSECFEPRLKSRAV